MTTYEIPERNMPWLREKVEKLNARAEKLGVTPVQMTVVGEKVKEVLDPNARDSVERSLMAVEGNTGRTIMLRFVVVEVVGEAPVLAGWKFIGTIQHVRGNGDSATVLRAVPGNEIPNEYRDADPEWCDQCKMSRRRNDTFVVRSVETSETKRVGRQCLKDFIGHPKPEMYADWAESLGLLGDLFRAAEHEYGAVGREDRIYLTRNVMALTAAAVSKYGWVSGKMAREAEERGEFLNRTRNVVLDAFTGNDSTLVATLADVSRGDAALTWAREELPKLVEQQPDNDYLYNLKEVMKLDALDFKMLGIAVSLLSAYDREMRKNTPADGTSQWFGEPGTRIGATVRVVEARSITMQNGGLITLIKFETPEGNQAVWFTNGSKGFVPGKTYRVKLTVKRHDERRGVKQTVVNRVSIMEEGQ